MIIYPEVTEEDINKLAKQQKNQRAIKIENKTSKQRHDKKLAKSFDPITKKCQKLMNRLKI